MSSKQWLSGICVGGVAVDRDDKLTGVMASGRPFCTPIGPLLDGYRDLLLAGAQKSDEPAVQFAFAEKLRQAESMADAWKAECGRLEAEAAKAQDVIMGFTSVSARESTADAEAWRLKVETAEGRAKAAESDWRAISAEREKLKADAERLKTEKATVEAAADEWKAAYEKLVEAKTLDAEASAAESDNATARYELGRALAKMTESRDRWKARAVAMDPYWSSVAPSPPSAPELDTPADQQTVPPPGLSGDLAAAAALGRAFLAFREMMKS